MVILSEQPLLSSQTQLSQKATVVGVRDFNHLHRFDPDALADQDMVDFDQWWQKCLAMRKGRMRPAT